jgi:hypothetical protein
MAKRKSARKASGKRKATARTRAATRKAARAKRAAPKRRIAAKRSRKAVKPAPKRRAVARTAARNKAVARKATKKAVARKARKVVSRAATATRRVVTRPSVPAARGRRPSVPLLRKPPSLDRERRIVSDEDEIIQSTPPSSLDLDRSASAVRSGRRALKERFDEHTETSPALTAGDVDADWESAYSVGDEAPGGDNPTPDQDIVDDIGRAVGIEYQDNEELKSEEKVAQRDRNRWELDPASSDDWDDR